MRREEDCEGEEDETPSEAEPLRRPPTSARDGLESPVDIPDHGTHDMLLAVQHTPSNDAAVSLFSSPMLQRQPNAGAHLPPEAAAT